MFPNERSLVKKMEGKPFALIGVDSDQSREALKKAIEKNHLTWRSFFDGPGTSGPIATEWNIQGWPTLYIIDAKGVIRYKHPGTDDKVESIVEKFVAEIAPKKVAAKR